MRNSTDEWFERDGLALNRLSPHYRIMEVNFISGNGSEIPLRPAATPKPATPAPTGTPATFDRTQSLETSLSQSPQVRPEKIARANALLSDSSYPSDQTLNQLAGFLATRIQAD
jgi:hypothetical protein